MATIRVSNVEAKADAGSPTIDERVTFKRSTGENGVVIDSKQVGITSVGINTDNPAEYLNIFAPSGTHAAIQLQTTTIDVDKARISKESTGELVIRSSNGSAGRAIVFETKGTGQTERMRIRANGEVGIGTDSTSEILTVNGHISSDPIFITTYGAGNLDITTEQTVDLDLTLSTSGTSDFTVSATGVITVLKTGTYQVSYSISTDVTTGSSRSISRAYLRLNGSGEQTASRTYMYNRLAGSGENTSAKTIMLPLTANDTLELRAVRHSGTDTVVVLEDYTTISLVRLT